jgi:hypothetical protein
MVIFGGMKERLSTKWPRWASLVMVGGMGFGIGRLSLSPEASMREPGAVHPKVIPQVGGAVPAAVESVRRNEPGVDWSWDSLPPGGAARQAAIVRRTEQVLGLASPSERFLAFAAFFEHYQPEDYESVIAGFRTHDQQGRLFAREYELFIQHCVAVEGERAVERMFEKKDRVTFDPNGWELEAMAEWSGKQGPAAVEWWNKLPEGNLRDALAQPVIAGMARTDPAAAWRSVQLFPAEERVKFTGIMVQQHLSNRGVAAAADWIHSLKSSEEIPGVQVQAARLLLQSMFLIPEEQRAEVMLPFVREPWFAESGVGQRLTGEWAAKDPSAAGAWIRQNLPESARQAILKDFAERFRQASPDQARLFEAAVAAP